MKPCNSSIQEAEAGDREASMTNIVQNQPRVRPFFKRERERTRIDSCLCYYDSVHLNREESRLTMWENKQTIVFSAHSGFGALGQEGI